MSSPPPIPQSPPPLGSYGSAPPPPPRKAQRGLAIAALVLGIGAVVLSPMLLGSVLGIVGLVLGVIYVTDRRPPFGSAITGVVLSLIGIGLSVYFAQFYFGRVQQFLEETIAEAQEDLSHWEGLEAPDFAARTLEGEQIALSQWRGQPVVVVAWGIFPPGVDAAFSGESVKESSASLLEWYNANSNAAQVLGVVGEWPEELLERMVHDNDVPFPNAVVEHLPHPFDRAVFPTAFLVDRDGNFSVVEKLPLAPEILEAHVAAPEIESESTGDAPLQDTSPEQTQTPEYE